MNERTIEAHGQSFGPRELASAFFRHKKKAAAFVLATLGVAALVILYAPRKYRSEAQLFLQVGRESIRLDPTATTGQTMALQQSGRDSEIATAVEVLKSRAIIEQAVDRLTPEVVLGEQAGGAKSNQFLETVISPLVYALKAVKSIDPVSKREEAVTAIKDNFWVDAEFDSTVIVLTYDGKTPQLAQQVVQAIVEVYEDTHVRLHQTAGSKPFFEQQRSLLAEQLASAEAALRDAKNQAGLASVDARRDTLEKRLADIELARNTTIQRAAAAEALSAALSDRIAAMPERVHATTRKVPNTGTDALRTELYALEVQLLDLEAKYQAEHPLVVAARSQLADAKAAIDNATEEREESEDALNENQRSLALDLARTDAEAASLRAQLAELDGQRAATTADVKQLNDLELKVDKLERDVTLASTNYFRYCEAFEQARMDAELSDEEITNVNVVQNATLMEKPVSPSKLVVAALSLVLAAAGSTALVLVCERFDSRLRTETQVEQALRLPVLAAVPEGRAYRHLPTAPR
jgi:polysaccharide biosynthesis protein PslE